jgi:hypothetical protein
VVDFKKFVLYSSLWDLIVKIELDLDDRLEWIMIERDSTIYELHNGGVGIFCGWPKFRKKYCIFVPLISIYFLFLFKFVLT